MAIKNTQATVMYSELFSHILCGYSNRMLPSLRLLCLNPYFFNRSAQRLVSNFSQKTISYSNETYPANNDSWHIWIKKKCKAYLRKIKMNFMWVIAFESALTWNIFELICISSIVFFFDTHFVCILKFHFYFNPEYVRHSSQSYLIVKLYFIHKNRKQLKSIQCIRLIVAYCRWDWIHFQAQLTDNWCKTPWISNQWQLFRSRNFGIWASTCKIIITKNFCWWHLVW